MAANDPPPPLRWFGPSWGAPCCDPRRQADAPEHANCSRCAKPFEPNAQGVGLLGYRAELQAWIIEYFHLECFLESLGLQAWVIECFHLECFRKSLGAPPSPAKDPMPKSHHYETAELLLQTLTGDKPGTNPTRAALLCQALDLAELEGHNRQSKEHELASGLISAWNLTPYGGTLLFSRLPDGRMCAKLTNPDAGAVLSTATNAEPELALAELLGRECARRGIILPDDGPLSLVCDEPAAVCDCSQHENERAARQSRCDHKFIDSKTCLKCGWDPKA